MKTRLFTEKLPEVIDCALAIVISTVPGFAEADRAPKRFTSPLPKNFLFFVSADCRPKVPDQNAEVILSRYKL
jgi:hypothetical protein